MIEQCWMEIRTNILTTLFIINKLTISIQAILSKTKVMSRHFNDITIKPHNTALFTNAKAHINVMYYTLTAPKIFTVIWIPLFVRLHMCQTYCNVGHVKYLSQISWQNPLSFYQNFSNEQNNSFLLKRYK